MARKIKFMDRYMAVLKIDLGKSRGSFRFCEIIKAISMISGRRFGSNSACKRTES